MVFSCYSCIGKPKTTLRDIMARLKIHSTRETRNVVIRALQKLTNVVKEKAKHVSVITVPAVIKLFTHLSFTNIILQELQSYNKLNPDPTNNDNKKVRVKGENWERAGFRRGS